MDLNIRRILVIAAVCVLLAMGGLFSVLYITTDTLGYGQKCGPEGCWGYTLERGKFVKKTSLRFWGPQGHGLHLEYELPGGTIERVSEDRWLAVDRAIYLDWRLKAEPAASGDRIRIVYDFQRGELHVASALPLWRLADFRSANPGHNWLTDSQLDSIVIQIEP